MKRLPLGRVWPANWSLGDGEWRLRESQLFWS